MYIRFAVLFCDICKNTNSLKSACWYFSSILEHDLVTHMYKFVLISVDKTNTFERWFSFRSLLFFSVQLWVVHILAQILVQVKMSMGTGFTFPQNVYGLNFKYSVRASTRQRICKLARAHHWLSRVARSCIVTSTLFGIPGVRRNAERCSEKHTFALAVLLAVDNGALLLLKIWLSRRYI